MENPLFFILLLAVIQGACEFLPISSSGHLVLVQHALALPRPGIQVEVMLHLGTLFSLLIYFKSELLRLFRDAKNGLFTRTAKSEENHMDSRWPWLILLSTLVTCILGLLGESHFEAFFIRPFWVLGAYVVMGFTLLATKRFGQNTRPLRISDAVIFGVMQSAALIPGISRSGITIAVLLFLGLGRMQAFLYSFLASVPVIIAACIYKIRGGSFEAYGLFQTVTGVIVACLVGLAALAIVKRLLIGERFHWFGYYCILIALLGLALLTV